MKFQTLVNEVVTLTNHPELADEIAIAIRAATLSLHQLDLFSKDKRETLVTIKKSCCTSNAIDLSLIPNLRSIHTIAKYCVKTCRIGCEIPKRIHIGQHIKEFWTTSGQSLEIKTTSCQRDFYLEYYANPQVIPAEDYSSWIADLYPQAILDLACAKIYRLLRDPTTSQMYERSIGSRAIPGSYAHTIIADQLAGN